MNKFKQFLFSFKTEFDFLRSEQELSVDFRQLKLQDFLDKYKLNNKHLLIKNKTLLPLLELLQHSNHPTKKPLIFYQDAQKKTQWLVSQLKSEEKLAIFFDILKDDYLDRTFVRDLILFFKQNLMDKLSNGFDLNSIEPSFIQNMKHLSSTNFVDFFITHDALSFREASTKNHLQFMVNFFDKYNFIALLHQKTITKADIKNWLDLIIQPETFIEDLKKNHYDYEANPKFKTRVLLAQIFTYKSNLSSQHVKSEYDLNCTDMIETAILNKKKCSELIGNEPQLPKTKKNAVLKNVNGTLVFPDIRMPGFYDYLENLKSYLFFNHHFSKKDLVNYQIMLNPMTINFNSPDFDESHLALFLNEEVLNFYQFEYSCLFPNKVNEWARFFPIYNKDHLVKREQSYFLINFEGISLSFYLMAYLKKDQFDINHWLDNNKITYFKSYFFNDIETIYNVLFNQSSTSIQNSLTKDKLGQFIHENREIILQSYKKEKLTGFPIKNFSEEKLTSLLELVSLREMSKITNTVKQKIL